MMKKNVLLHIAMVAVMLAVACAYLSPALSGKVIRQGDIQKWDAMAHQQLQAKEQNGTIPNWAGSMFSGMPGYQITLEAPKSVFQVARDILTLRPLGLHRDIGVIFLYLLGFYVALLAFGLSPWLALVGALAFGLGSYNIIIIEAGHITKAWAMSMMAPVLAGMFLTLRTAVDGSLDKRRRSRRLLWGTLLFTFALIMQISFNHIQITFYTALGCVLMGVAYLVYALVKKRLVPFITVVAVLAVGAALAFGCNVRQLLVNEEYARYTMRGGNELTVTPADLYGERAVAQAQNTATGLDIDYAFSWSYGIGETYTLLVPGAMGGGSGEPVSHESACYKNFRQEQAPLYWGNQPFTSGPVYFGAIVVFLFLLGFILVKGPERWWLLAATVIAIILSWGRNFMPFNEWVFNHLPLYNKFRTPSMSLVLANVCMVLLGMLGLRDLFSKEVPQKRKNLALYISGGITALVLLAGLIVSGSLPFSGAADTQMAPSYGNQWAFIQSIFIEDRKALFQSDSWRSLIFVVLTFVTLWLYINKLGKGKAAPVVFSLVLVVLTIADLWSVDRRYLDDKNFAEKRQLELRRDRWDYDIDEQAARYGDRDFRVLNLAVNTYNDSKPSAFHNQIGGYSAAKLSRYQNLIDFYLSGRIRPEVLAMLNTRYVVLNNGQVQRNPDALGNCWFVQDVKWVDDANGEILALNDINPATTAVINKNEFSLPENESVIDSNDRIEMEHLTPNNPDYLRYHSHTSDEQLAVFSEIYYKPDWFAYIDGKRVDYLRANYVLRALVVPAGDHVIEFKNEAPRLHRLDAINLVISICTLLLMVGGVLLVYRNKEKKAQPIREAGNGKKQ